MNKIKYITLAAILFSMFSCREENGHEAHLVKNDTIPAVAKDVEMYSAEHAIDYIIFGRFCGECAGECATMYKYDVANNKLFADHTDSYWKYNNGESMMFATAVPELKNIAHAKELSGELPDFILNTKEAEQRFGCPDCTDGCGLFVEIKKDNTVHKFYIDNQTEKLEGEVRSFAEELQDVIAEM